MQMAMMKLFFQNENVPVLPPPPTVTRRISHSNCKTCCLHALHLSYSFSFPFPKAGRTLAVSVIDVFINRAASFAARGLGSLCRFRSPDRPMASECFPCWSGCLISKLKQCDIQLVSRIHVAFSAKMARGDRRGFII